ncbi:MAG: right-handed parallel beta-helix repeat-containing protein [Armatimonadota bacterium]
MHTRSVLLGLLVVVMIGAEAAAAPPWEPAYKIKPHETDRLTAADVVGPDGIVYPDWRYAGVPGGIPSAPERARVEEFGGRPDDDRDDSAALEAGAKAVAQRGGGALVLREGAYHLDRPVLITDDNVVIRGQRAEATKLVFRYNGPPGGVGFYRPAEGAVVGPDTWIEIHARPDGLRRIALEADGTLVSELTYEAMGAGRWGGTYLLRAFGDEVVQRAEPGERTLRAVAEWRTGEQAEASIRVRVDPEHRIPEGRQRYPLHWKASIGAIMFYGDRRSGEVWELARDGKRGGTEIVLKTEPSLEPGDAIVLYAPATERWNKLVQNACRWAEYRRYELRVAGVRGNRVRLNQPLRIDFPAVDGATAQRIHPIRRCGIEDLSLEQTQKVWTTGILMAAAWECWAKGVRVLKAGRHPVYTRWAKWCEIRDCVLEDAWYHGGGGTAYVGWERSYDCLMENVSTRRMRHAPCLQWSAAGNVVRKCTFHDSDLQWHAGWTNENLVEQCSVNAAGKTGSYGYGGWGSPPGDRSHGPEGPRNVVYNCDIRSPRSGLSMGGMNENWLILYNRFLVGSGAGILARTYSFDHIIRGNVIALAQGDAPVVHLRTPDCTGVEIVGNRVYGGSGELVMGPGVALVAAGNHFEAYAKEPARPTPEVASIFEWQRREGARGR